MASCRRRLGTLLTDDGRDLRDVLRVLDATAAPRGRELAAALALQQFCAQRWPAIDWQVQRVGASGANLVASHGPGALLYSHLDTSLPTPPDIGPLLIGDQTVDGFGLAVARGPAAAALVAFARAAAGTLLLASSGTHRRGQDAAGVLAYLAARPTPAAAIVAKCGPPGVLWSEPGALYLTVEVSGGAGVVMAPGSAVPRHGLPAGLAPVLNQVAEWCAEYVAAHPPIGQLGAAAGIGAITAGLPDKPDLYPARAQLGLYVVTMPDTSPAGLADELAGRIEAPPGCTVTVTSDPVHEAACTEPAAPIVHAALDAWRAEFGASQDITGWTGSTDGVVLRGRGIDTVRLGPQPTSSADDPRRDVLHLDQLAGFVRVYRALLA